LNIQTRISKFFAALLLLFLKFQQNYFEGLTKLFSDLYPAQFKILQQNRFFHVFIRFHICYDN